MRAVVLGAGPAGLAAAHALEAGGADVIVLEAGVRAGGMAGSHRLGGHLADFGPHRLHVEASHRVRALLQRPESPLVDRARSGTIHFEDRSVTYPLGPLRTLLDLGPSRALTYAVGAISARLGRAFSPAERRASHAAARRTYADVARSRVGRPLARDLYDPAARKIWGLDPDRLDGDQARARVGVQNVTSLFQRWLGGNEPGRYLYPEVGANGLAYEAWARALASDGVAFRFHTEVAAILHSGGRVTAAEATSPGGTLTFSADRVVSTLALPRLLERLSPQLEGTETHDALALRTVIILYVVLGRERLTARDVHYFPSESRPFARMTEQAAFGRAEGSPSNETVISFDFYDDPGGPRARATAEDLFEMVWPTLAAFGASRAEIRRLERIAIPNAYPVFRSGYREARDRALDLVASIDGLFATGRGGLFLHVNQHHAIEMGLAAGRAALSGASPSLAWRQELRRFEDLCVVD